MKNENELKEQFLFLSDLLESFIWLKKPNKDTIDKAFKMMKNLIVNENEVKLNAENWVKEYLESISQHELHKNK